MDLSSKQIELLKTLMQNSARKVNLANAGLVLEDGKDIASVESLVGSNHDATAHSERMLVEIVGKKKRNNYTPGLTMITVVEPCIMCMSACSQAGYKRIAYIIPANKYVEKIPYMTDSTLVNKEDLATKFSNPIELVHLEKYQEEFCKVFETAMADELK